MTGVRLFTLLNPAIGLIFGIVFFATWLSQRNRTYILSIALASLCYAAGAAVQVLWVPSSAGANTMLSCFFYLSSLCLFVHGLLTRAQVPTNFYVLCGLAGAIFVLIFYFFYVERSLAIRIYVLNFGAGLILSYAAFGLSRSADKRPINRFLFWVVLLAGLHFFPRTLLSVAGDGPFQLGAFSRSAFWTALNFSLVILSLMICLTLLLAIALDVIEDLKGERNTDTMTDLLNRRGFEESAKTLLDGQGDGVVSLIYCDIDHFKAINDTYGHAAGDAVIRDVARLLAQEIDPRDIAARIGGEEFAILRSAPGADLFAERLRQRVAAHRFPGLPAGRSVTASFGIAERRRAEPLAGLMRRADRLLYVAKRAGRNRAQMEETPIGTT